MTDRAASDVGFDPVRLSRVAGALHRFVDEGRLPFTAVQVARHGEAVYADWYGWADVEAETPIEPDAIVRIYSMTKPVTSVATLTFVEDGSLLLDNPVARFIPSFADMMVDLGDGHLEPARRPMTVHDLLTQQAGLTAGFMPDRLAGPYRAARLGNLMKGPEGTLEEVCDRLADLPLLHHPGEAWNYGMATDVLGRVLEIVGGRPLDAVLRERVLDPLGMVDTEFWCPTEKADRRATVYARTPSERMGRVAGARHDPRRSERPEFLSGAGGLVSTMADYQRFADMLRAGGVGANGARVLSPHSVTTMTSNHLTQGRELGADAQFLETTGHGVGFGLGVAVVLDPAQTHQLCSVGEYYWGGAASTVFWVDPVEDLTVIFLTQLMPSRTYPLRPLLRNLVYQALADRASPARRGP